MYFKYKLERKASRIEIQNNFLATTKQQIRKTLQLLLLIKLKISIFHKKVTTSKLLVN